MGGGVGTLCPAGDPWLILLLFFTSDFLCSTSGPSMQYLGGTKNYLLFI